MSPWTQQMIAVLIAMSHVNAFRECTQSNICSNEYTCNATNTDCITTCSTSSTIIRSCNGDMKLTCEDPNQLCKVECGANACALDIVSSASTEIICDGVNACNGMDITVVGDGSNDVFVNITCVGKNSCTGLTINLLGSGANNEFSLFCASQQTGGSNDYSCDAVTVNCNFDNAQCSVECGSSNRDSCNHPYNTLNCLTNGVGTTCENLTPSTPGGFGFLHGITYIPSASPTEATSEPTISPTASTDAPTLSPSAVPTALPTNSPTAFPSSAAPSFSPSGAPSEPPSAAPSQAPSRPPTDAPSTASPTAAWTDERDIYNVTLVGDDLHCQQLEEIMDMFYDIAWEPRRPIVLNVTTECEHDEIAPVSCFLSVPSESTLPDHRRLLAHSSLRNETSIADIFDTVIDEYTNGTDIDVDIIVRRVVPMSIPNSTPLLTSTLSTKDDTEDDTSNGIDALLELLDLQWWIAIGAGVVILCLLVVCALRPSTSTKIVNKGNTTIYENKTDNREANIATYNNCSSNSPMGRTAMGPAQDREEQVQEQEPVTKQVAPASNKKNKEKDEEKASGAQLDHDTVVRNALVLSVGVTHYKNMKNLPGVSRDVENYRNLWKNVYNYRVIPDEDDHDAHKWFNKEYWTFEEIEEFVNEKRKELLDHNDQLLYDALIITINGHGTKDGVLPSDYDAKDAHNDSPVDYSFLQLQVGGTWKPVLSTIPRIYIVDACRGSEIGGAVQSDADAVARAGGSALVHKDELACMLYGNSPGLQVKESVAKGGNFSQCVVRELEKTRKNEISQSLSQISGRVSKALLKLTNKEQTCWLEGDPQCFNVAFARKDSSIAMVGQPEAITVARSIESTSIANVAQPDPIAAETSIEMAAQPGAVAVAPVLSVVAVAYAREASEKIEGQLSDSEDSALEQMYGELSNGSELYGSGDDGDGGAPTTSPGNDPDHGAHEPNHTAES